MQLTFEPCIDVESRKYLVIYRDYRGIQDQRGVESLVYLVICQRHEVSCISKTNAKVKRCKCCTPFVEVYHLWMKWPQPWIFVSSMDEWVISSCYLTRFIAEAHHLETTSMESPSDSMGGGCNCNPYPQNTSQEQKGKNECAYHGIE